VMRFDALNAGLRVAPLAVVLLIVGPISPRMAERYGSKAMVATGLGLSAAGLALLATTNVDSGYMRVLAAIVTIALGFALSMAPATESIMGSVPRARAGVGSAVNNTMRQVGGALGVAVLGGLLVSGYHSSLDSHAAELGLSGGSLTAARASIGNALALARHTGGRLGAAIADRADRAFIQGLHLSLGVGAVVCLLGALLALALLPARAQHHEVEPAGQPAAGLVIAPDELGAAVAAD
jgi:Na+/melibiose symporter-like transporter